MADQVPGNRKVEESTANLRVILDTVVDAIITIDERGIVQMVNPAAERMFGYTAGEMVGRNVSMLMPSPYRDEHDGYLANYCRTREAKIIGIGREVIGLRKDGSEFPLDLAVSEVVSDGTRMFTGIIRDITDRKRNEARLVQSERLAAIGQMVTGLAHESRNALQRARACLDMLSLDLADEPRHLELMQRIQLALLELQRLYQEVRAYASPINLSLGTCRLADLWRKSWQDLVQTDDVQSISLVEEGTELDTTCSVDHYRIEQVFRNVLENAVAVSRSEGGVTLRCRETQLHGCPALKVSITDEGPGLRADQISRVFEPFYTTKQRGTGLGLPICERIIHAHGGEIRIQSTPPNGTTVDILIPRSPE
jgi:two-component system, LuxR family, sensor kinase FixL